jgi:uncharacterized protein (DUF433 family)
MSMVTRKSFINSDPEILSGKVVIRGTRIPISRILFLLKEDYSLQDIHEEYPNVSIKTIKGIIDELVKVVDNKVNAPEFFQTQAAVR